MITEQLMLRISPDSVARLTAHRQLPSHNEAGGILLGRVYPHEVVVERITEPGPLDRAGRFTFNRSRKAAQRAVNGAWKRSEGEQIYLGEWHTHPEAVPHPSLRDRAMIRNMMAQTQMEISFLLLIIVGTDGAWVGVEDGQTLQQLVEGVPETDRA